MVFDLRRYGARRVALISVVSTLLVVLSFASTVSAQLGTPVASPLPTEAGTTLPPAWLQLGPDGKLIARAIVDGECPALAVDGIGVGMTRRAPASEVFP